MICSMILAPGVVSIPSFLSAQQCAEIISKIEIYSWEKAFVGLYRSDELIDKRLDLKERDVEVLRLPFHFDEICPEFSTRIHDVVSTEYGITNIIIDGFVMSKYVPGCHIRTHTDTGVNSTSRLFTCVQYFNDQYNGGEIIFPRLGLSHRPKGGELVLFYSEYPHAVGQITHGLRYCMVSFARAKSILNTEKF